MAKLTITEALQEIKTIGKRLEKKRASLLGYLVRDFRVRDPLEKDGGSEKFIAEERQAINDLECRIIAIRTSIQRSNLNSSITVGATGRTVAEWLTWRREVSGPQTAFLTTLTQGLTNMRNDTTKKGAKVIAAGSVAVNEAYSPSDPPNIVVNIDERKLMSEREDLERTLGDLDGKLSLFNATTVMEL